MQTDKQFGIVGKRMILACDTAGLPLDVDGASGLHTLTESMVLGMLHNAGLWIGPRNILEECTLYRQIIPYVVLRCGDQIVHYRRTPAAGESRLHGKVSIGFGGHIDLPDICFADGSTVDLWATLSRAAYREVHEEVDGVVCIRQQALGLLIDNSNDVGRVHIGVAMVWDLDRLPVGSSEKEIAHGGASQLAELQADMLANYEVWTQMLLKSNCLAPQ